MAQAATGASNQEIAYGLGLNDSTAGRHLSRAAAKLGLSNRGALITAYRASFH